MGGTAFVIPIEEKYSRSFHQLIGVDNPISIHISEPFARIWKGRCFALPLVVSHREGKNICMGLRVRQSQLCNKN